MRAGAGVSLLDASGKPLQPTRPHALAEGLDRVPYDAASFNGAHVAAWNPVLWSPDGEIDPYRDRIVARVRDLVRNDGWASGAVTRILDAAIGGSFRPIFKPDWLALQHMSGNAAFDHVWADEYRRALTASWRGWANHPGFWCDAQRGSNFRQLMWTGFRHLLIDGDALAVLLYLPERVAPGRARYATAIQLVDPDRLSNPQMFFDQKALRGGVEVDAWGAAEAYHIRRAHQGDWWAAADSVIWDRIPRETDWGRPIVVHHFTRERAGMHRGGAGIFTPVVNRLKMLIKYDGTELDAAIVNAIFSAYVESPFDHELVGDALAGDKGLPAYQQDRVNYHRDHPAVLGGVKLPIFYPGEKIATVAANRPAGNFKDFEAAMLRNVAAATGLSAQQISNNWSDVNYSSARGAMLEAWKTLDRRRVDFGVGFCSQIAMAFVEEAMDTDTLPLPSGVVPDFLDARAAYTRCEWMGPGRGWIDPVAERQGAVLGMDAGLSTLERECAESAGADWEEELGQRKIEFDRFQELGLPRPVWFGMPAASAAQPAEKPQPA